MAAHACTHESGAGGDVGWCGVGCCVIALLAALLAALLPNELPPLADGCKEGIGSATL